MGALIALAEVAPAAASNEELWETWRVEMVAAGCRPRTIREREILFGHLCRWLPGPVITATRRDLMSWLARDDLSAKTRQNYKSFLHTLFTVAQDAELRADNPTTRLPRSRVPRVEANPISTPQLERLLATSMYRDTRTMILLGAYQGFRVAEISAVRGENVDLDEGLILTAEAKGGLEVWRPLHPLVADAAAAYPREGWWFPSHVRAGEHVKPNSVSGAISNAMRRAGIAGHRPHNLRAWFATQLVEAGADMITVQHAMRHASPATLGHYVKPSMSNIDSAIRDLPNLAHVQLHSRSNTPARPKSERPARPCTECGELLPSSASSRQRFCGDTCRYHHRDRQPERVARDAERARRRRDARTAVVSRDVTA